MPKEDHEDVPGIKDIKVRVIFEMPSDTRDWPGDFKLAKLVKNETQDKTSMSEMCKSERYGYHDRAYMNDYQPHDYQPHECFLASAPINEGVNASSNFCTGIGICSTCPSFHAPIVWFIDILYL